MISRTRYVPSIYPCTSWGEPYGLWLAISIWDPWVTTKIKEFQGMECRV